MSDDIQFITDREGNRTGAILSLELLEKIVLGTEHEDLILVPVAYEPGENDEVTIPHGVVNYLHPDGYTTLLTAWRLYRGIDVVVAADAIGLGVEEFINLEVTPTDQINPSALTDLATLYECSPEQFTQ